MRLIVVGSGVGAAPRQYATPAATGARGYSGERDH